MSDQDGPQSVYSSDPAAGEPELLTIGAAAPKERADAARNRARILTAASRLFAERGIPAVSMDQIAAAAGVGKGTLFRRFGDKAGLAAALIDARERELQSRVLSGPPPLGPEAAPGERLLAFLTTYADFLDANLDLLHVSETASPGARYRIGSYRLWHRHVAYLLGEAAPDLDADYLAHALLAPLAADHYKAVRDEAGPQRVREGIVTLARGLLQPPGRVFVKGSDRHDVP
jgi:AcrR family transcriptional regulator